MIRSRNSWYVGAVTAWSCFSATTSASGQALGPDARPFSKCERIPNASRLDALRRPGIVAVQCRITRGLRFAILMDETVSWPMIKDGARGWASLEDPVAAKVWFPNISPLRIRFSRDVFLTIAGDGSKPSAVVYSAVASRTDVQENVEAFVAVRISPPCVLGVSRQAEEAVRLARDRNGVCISPVRR